jgi:DNA-binding LacI/PurR family transcriptional regulator
MAPTILDVARAAGVSASTVSRALSRSPLVTEATRERVEHSARELGYEPNRAARQLVTGRTHNLGLIVPDLANPFFPGIVKGVQARAHQSDHSVFVADTDEDPKAEVRLASTLAKQVDGIILCSPRMAADQMHELAAGTAVVVMNRRVDGLAWVTTDNAGGIRQAANHLAALGHRRIAYVAGPANSWSSAERLDGLRRSTADLGVELVEFGCFAPVFSSGEAAADLVLAAGTTAVMAYNDLVALGLLSRFAARGVDVPAQVSVIGYDGIAISAMCSPALTTVVIPQERAARAAVDMLMSLLGLERGAGGAEATEVELETQLVVRASTGPAPGKGA